MGATRPGRFAELRLLDAESVLTPEGLDGFLRPRVWGPFEVDMGATGSEPVIQVPTGKQLILTGVLIWQGNKGTVTDFGVIEILSASESITGPIYVEALGHEYFRHAVTGRGIEADGEISISVVQAEIGTGSPNAQIYLEGYMI